MRSSSTRNRSRCVLVLGCCAVVAVSGIPAAGQQRLTAKMKKVAPANSLVSAGDAARPLDGAWRLVRALDPRSGQLREIPAGIEMTKLVVGGRFAWVVAQNGRAIAGAGGTYAVNGDSYSETVSYAVGQNQQGLIGTTTTFTWKLEGGKWHHKGTLRAGQAKQEIEEMWERVPEEKRP